MARDGELIQTQFFNHHADAIFHPNSSYVTTKLYETSACGCNNNTIFENELYIFMYYDDMVNFKNMVFMYKVYNQLLPANIMSYFKTINACHNHNVRMPNCHFKIKFSRTTKHLNVLV